MSRPLAAPKVHPEGGPDREKLQAMLADPTLGDPTVEAEILGIVGPDADAKTRERWRGEVLQHYLRALDSPIPFTVTAVPTAPLVETPAPPQAAKSTRHRKWMRADIELAMDDGVSSWAYRALAKLTAWSHSRETDGVIEGTRVRCILTTKGDRRGAAELLELGMLTRDEAGTLRIVDWFQPTAAEMEAKRAMRRKPPGSPGEACGKPAGSLQDSCGKPAGNWNPRNDTANGESVLPYVNVYVNDHEKERVRDTCSENPNPDGTPSDFELVMKTLKVLEEASGGAFRATTPDAKALPGLSKFLRADAESLGILGSFLKRGGRSLRTGKKPYDFRWILAQRDYLLAMQQALHAHEHKSLPSTQPKPACHAPARIKSDAELEELRLESLRLSAS